MTTILKTKSDSNFIFAGSIINQQTTSNYHTSVHCLYYSCFQYMLHIETFVDLVIPDESLNISNSDDSNDRKKKDPHNKLINKFTATIETIKQDEIADQFFIDIQQLKTLRHKADYKNFTITRKVVIEAQTLARKILDILRQIFGL